MCFIILVLWMNHLPFSVFFCFSMTDRKMKGWLNDSWADFFLSREKNTPAVMMAIIVTNAIVDIHKVSVMFYMYIYIYAYVYECVWVPHILRYLKSANALVTHWLSTLKGRKRTRKKEEEGSLLTEQDRREEKDWFKNFITYRYDLVIYCPSRCFFPFYWSHINWMIEKSKRFFCCFFFFLSFLLLDHWTLTAEHRTRLLSMGSNVFILWWFLLVFFLIHLQ